MQPGFTHHIRLGLGRRAEAAGEYRFDLHIRLIDLLIYLCVNKKYVTISMVSCESLQVLMYGIVYTGEL